MAKIYFFNGGSHGHVYPTLGLVAELVRRGDEIIYYCTDDFKPVIERTGAVFRAYPVEAPDEPIESLPQFATYFLRHSAKLLPHLIETARMEQPDYIIFDMFRLWGLQLGQYLNIPAVCCCPSFGGGMQVMQRVAPEVFSQDVPAPTEADPYVEEYARIAAILKAQYGVDSPAIMEIESVPCDLTICFIIPSLQPAIELVEDRYRLVGATITPRPDDGSFPIERLQQKRVVFISLGTVFNEQPEFYKRCIEAFRGTNYTVVMAVGTQTMVDTLGEMPPNFIVRPFVPQLEVLQHTDVFITHGGMGSIQEALYYDVPMLIYPQMIEQVINAQQVERLGAGVRLVTPSYTEFEPGLIETEPLREAVEQVMNTPEYKRSAERLGQELRQCSPADAADVVQAFVREKAAITGD
jgi:MGT family glycosyltransferase